MSIDTVDIGIISKMIDDHDAILVVSGEANILDDAGDTEQQFEFEQAIKKLELRGAILGTATSPKMCQELGVYGYPTLLRVDADGEVTKYEGAANADQYVSFLRTGVPPT